MNIIRAMGAVFGDIGTSPLYTLAVIALLTKPQKDQIFGIVSLIIWTMIILVTVQYAWFAMNLSIRGEGGTVVLGEIAKSLSNSKKLRSFIRYLVVIGLAFLIGDGIITPAITILSASEGIRFIPGFENTPQQDVLILAIIITILLFSVQSKGTGKLGEYFGPIMLVWFTSIGLIGLYYVLKAPQILLALSPHYGVEFLLENPLKGFLVLSEVILAATGGEALYADMGHLGRVAIRRAWMYVFPMLVLNYMGQGAFLMLNTADYKNNPFFETARQLLGETLYIPFLILVILASVIAAQALISGVFSIIFQAINIRIAPLLRIKHTSTEISTQIYVPFANWLLFAGVIFMYINFKTSDSMAAAYGFSVNVVMVITGFLLTLIHFLRREIFYTIGSLLLFLVDILFLMSSMNKLQHGGYWSVVFAMFPMWMFILYMKGQERLYKNMEFMPFKDFVLKFENAYRSTEPIPGTAIFLIRDLKFIPPYVINTMFEHGIVYEDNVFLSLIKDDKPFGVEGFIKGSITKGLRLAEIRYGYMEIPNVEEELRKLGIKERVIFYGMEQVYTEKFVWKIFGLIKRVSPSFVEFYRFPEDKLHGVTVRVEL